MLAEDRHDNPEGFILSTDQVFEGIRLDGARVLEIGSGTGLWSIYLALRGARVVSLEPELVGSTSGVIAKQQRRCAELGVSVQVIPEDFNTWNTSERFDVIVSRASLNHLHASEHHAESHPDTYAAYQRVARHIHELLAPGGVFVATDASRYALFTMGRRWLKAPWRPKKTGVNWRHHQNPSTWSRIFRSVGFSRTRVEYPIPYPFRGVPWLVNNVAANFVLKGSFILRAWR
jgi:SAM-dependent methyltransferase